MPDHEDNPRGIAESIQRFYSLFSEWICNLTFKQLSSVAKSPSSASHSNYFEEHGSHSSSRTDREGETILLSSDDELDADYNVDGDKSGEHMQPPLQTSSKRPYSHSAHRSRFESTRNPRFGARTCSPKPRVPVGNRSDSQAKMDDERFFRNNSSQARDADYGQNPSKRAVPPSSESFTTRTKKNTCWDNLSKNQGYFRTGNADNPYMDNNSSPIFPPIFPCGKAGRSAGYTSTSDPDENMGPDEDTFMGDETVIFQAALQDLNQPKGELDVPSGSLTVPLMRHQKIALAWMVEKELRTMHCLGGILADDQGLGKTISTIALILKQWPAQVKSKSKNINNHNAEALTSDEDDDDNKGNKINSQNVGKCKLEEVSINEHKTLIIDMDDVVESATTEAAKKMKNVDDCSASAEGVKKKDNAEGSKSYSGSSFSHQTFKRKRPSAGTLIVCPATVLRQWHRELNEKVSQKAKLKVLSYHGSNRIKDPDKLADYDVVLTTYSIVAIEAPKQPIVDEEDIELKTGEKNGLSSDFSVGKKRKNPSTTSKKEKKGKKLADSLPYGQAGALARVNWFRVVLDEAQTIKNHRTLTARACCGLRAKRRWCLSGTPIQNKIDEMYSYFKFLRHQYYSSYKNFNDFIKDPITRDPNIGYKKLQAVLRTLLLRRTKDTLLDGEPIISLPPKSIEMKTLNFTVLERAFYNQLEAESRSQYKAYAAAGTVNKNYANILLMILRLRQACDHPILVTGYNSESLRRTNLDKARELPRHFLMGLLNHLEAVPAICLLCSDPAEDAVVTICGHVFCYQCVGGYINGDDTQCPAHRCKELLSEDVFFSKAALKSCLSGDVDGEFSNGNGSFNSSSILSREYISSKIKAALEILRANCRSNGQPMECDEMREANTEHSEHVKVRTEKFDDLSSQGPIKTIIFSQWTRMLDLFEYSLNLHCIQFRRLDGSMPLIARDRAVRDFNTDPKVTVILMSLKAGNLGLNMVAACHVILLDLWWNPTTEDQAIDRAHRIGQTRPVAVSRITVKDSVEDRILALQEKKRKMVASTFGEEHVAGSNVKLTAEDLRFFLFGDQTS